MSFSFSVVILSMAAFTDINVKTMFQKDLFNLSRFKRGESGHTLISGKLEIPPNRDFGLA